jgi:hypothetical protein
MRAKLILLTIVILAISGIALPQTVTLFAGQHYWYSLTESEASDVPCEKCHADIAEEMELHFGPHTGEAAAGHRMDCKLCHRTYKVSGSEFIYGRVQTSYTSYTPGREVHAATVPACMDCHKYVSSTDYNAGMSVAHWDYPEYKYSTGFAGPTGQACDLCHGIPNFHAVPYAGGFGLTNGTGDTGSLAAHREFVLESINDTTLKGENEACVGCHTYVAVKINFSHARSLEFNIGLGSPITTDYGPHNWSVTDWQTNGTAYAIIWGNTTGNASTTYGEIEWPGNIDSIYS